jgi:hypothetical protein
MVASVAVHELTHALYDSAPLLQYLAIMGQFVGSPKANIVIPIFPGWRERRRRR